MRSGRLAALGLLPAFLVPLITAAVFINPPYFILRGPVAILVLLPIVGPLLLALGCLRANTRTGLVLTVAGFIVLGGLSLTHLLFQVISGAPESTTGLAAAGAGVGGWGAFRLLREGSTGEASSAGLVRAGFGLSAGAAAFSALSFLVVPFPSSYTVGTLLVSAGYALAAYAYPEPAHATLAQPTQPEAAPRL